MPPNLSVLQFITCLVFTLIKTHSFKAYVETRKSAKTRRKREGRELVYLKWFNALITFSFELCHEYSNNVVCATSKSSDQPAHTGSLISAFASCLNSL